MDINIFLSFYNYALYKEEQSKEAKKLLMGAIAIAAPYMSKKL